MFLTTGVELPRERGAGYQRYMLYLNLNVRGFGNISATSLSSTEFLEEFCHFLLSALSGFYHEIYDLCHLC